MSDQKNQIALEALNKIIGVVNSVREVFPISPEVEGKAEKARNKKAGKPINPFKILKRVDGIIRNYHEGNAERKLRSLMDFLSVFPKDFK